jgi:alkylhydroperoxidase/carboxymuconolactone decarboxylase family protein YurZ
MGHLSEMALRSGVDVELVWDKLPWLEGVLGYAAQSILPGAIERNKESCGHAVVAAENVTETMIDICYDPQTSGGLLMAVENSKAAALLERLHASGLHDAALIGHVCAQGTGKINVQTDGTRQFPSEPIEVSGSAADNTSDTVPSEGLDAYTKRAIRIALAVSRQSKTDTKTEIEKARSMGYTQNEIDEVIEIAESGSL